ncbi:hypothetical protein EYF80_020679 [Liparis tanakae]|uniref:Uncharacterized protein n=1 Tax=Liparis tanakae TaxID=230148 RepID=A0A4Z2HTB3_9TELE|nr:hypothetical protein EYF80_020679 [Liparis tanakae]
MVPAVREIAKAGVTARLSSTSGMLLSTKGSSDLSSTCRNIDIHNTAVGSFGPEPAENSTHILGEDAAGQTLLDLVVPGKRLLFRLELEDVQYWDKGFGMDDGSVVSQPGDDGGLHVVSRSIDHLSSADHSATLLLGLLNSCQILIHSLFSVQRPVKGGGIPGVSDADLFVGLGEPLNYRVMKTLVQHQPSGGRAALASGSHRCKDGGGYHKIQVSVLKHNDCIVSTELQQLTTKPVLHHHGHHLADMGAASERHQIHPLILCHGCADIGTSAGHGADGTGQVVLLQHLSHNLGNCHTCERCGWSSFPEADIAAGQSDGIVPAVHSHRKVKGRDDADKTDWVPLFDQGMARSL